MKRKNIVKLVLVMIVSLTLPAAVHAAQTINGQMQGFNCVLHGTHCPLDNLDPHLMLESDFVLLVEGGDYYLIPNIARIVKAKYVHKSIRVTGKVNAKYKSLEADKLEVKDGGSYKTVWTKQMMLEELKKREEEFYGSGGGA